ncbi:YqiA/YcfP family alpha/beta fold hydrolase [Calothrix sp. 336/3]|uniref:YqiA/YcfP family alpha/beta fold hydrolase n=1 Tax=Calothrix sp. 336/3 TaxID=1337936 RepID=UPI0006248332|nr:YqiA/YcfP family alpha/beta fold hydrolase [Calothrix sp. 336/3]AKG22306.1 esterase [Calothrix sp. 336/3]
MQYIYLHGFASSPNSAKAKYFRDRYSQLSLSLDIPDLNQGDFSHLTITRQIQQISSQFSEPSSQVTLIGSSLGGLTSALIAEKYHQVQQLILLAPAFDFLSHWLPKLGEEKVKNWQEENYINVYHYGEKQELPLSYDFILDAQQYHDKKLQRSLPTLIFHGIHDEVIPIQASRNYAKNRPWVKLVELDSDHALDNVLAEIWQGIKQHHNFFDSQKTV